MGVILYRKGTCYYSEVAAKHFLILRILKVNSVKVQLPRKICNKNFVLHVNL